MALQKKITDLQPRALVTDDLSIPSDDTIQSYRITALQLKNYILSAGGIARAMLAVGAVPRFNYAAKTGAYTLTANDDVVTAGGAALTLTLPTAVGKAGQTHYIKKTDASLTNIITIDGNAAETIDGSLTTTLNTQNESITIVSDGSNWIILNRSIPSQWAAVNSATITGFGAPTNVALYSRREGQDLLFRGVFTSGVATAVTAKVNLAYGGGTANGNVVVADANAIKANGMVVGSGYFSVPAAASLVTLAQPGDTWIFLGIQSASGGGYASTNATNILSNGQTVSFFAQVPIEGWKS